MKKKNIIIIGGILIIVIITYLIVMFISNINKDKELRKNNIETINNSYNNIKTEVTNYNNLRKDITSFVNDFYYETIEAKYQSNLNLLNNYDEIISKITKEVKILDSKCNIVYNDSNITNICNNYKNDYETVVNVFINDINSYNNKLESYNKDENKELKLFKSKTINDYIDYNNDNVYKEKVETNG